jgi:hypothetical protein
MEHPQYRMSSEHSQVIGITGITCLASASSGAASMSTFRPILKVSFSLGNTPCSHWLAGKSTGNHGF